MAFATAFCGGVSAVFLISGTGEPLIRVLVFVIFFVSAINFSIYVKEIVAEKTKKPAPPPARQGGGGQNNGGGGRLGDDRPK